MWLNLSPEGRLEVLTNVSEQINLSPNAIEKDWWVTMSLRALFSSFARQLHSGKGINRNWFPLID